MEYLVKIEVCGKTPYVETSPEMPFLLADEIIKVVTEFYSEENA